MDKQKDSSGLSVREIEEFAKRHRFEVFLCLLLVLACFFSFLFFGTGWAVLLTMVGGVIGVLLPKKALELQAKIFSFIFRQETTTQLVIGGVAVLLAILVPPVIFFALGKDGALALHRSILEASAKK